MQDLALAEGALPRHLHTAMFTQSSDGRMLTVRQLSRHLVGLWVTGHPTAMALLKRIMVRVQISWKYIVLMSISRTIIFLGFLVVGMRGRGNPRFTD